MHIVIDHFDSFTYNLVQMLREILGESGEVRVIRSDAFRPEEFDNAALSGIVLSPGPGSPSEYPASRELIRRQAGRTPLLGVCLGHELIVDAFGGAIRKARRVMHGKTDETLTDGRGCFRNIPSPAAFMRYHSLAADAGSLPDCLEACAWSRLDGDVMAVRHREHQIEGLQFHPESIGSEAGRRVVENFFNYRREPFPAKRTLSRLLAREDIGRADARAFMLEAAEGNLTDAQIAGFLCAFESKGVTAEELAGCASVLADKCRPFRAGVPVLDIVGVGGDGKGSFNLSSMAALVAAACGQAVAKHGNRAVSSFCGSADFFAELGYPLTLPAPEAERLLEKTGFAFLFAPLYHSAMRHAVTARRQLAVRTPMNLLGPLVNPAGARYQVLGVPDAGLLHPMADAAVLLGAGRVMTIRSEDGLDEFSCSAPTRCVLAEGDSRREFVFDPAEAGISGCSPDALKGGTAEDNAAMARRLLAGEELGGVMDAVCLNAGAGLFVAGAAGSVAEGYGAAREAFREGRVSRKLEEVLAIANSPAV